jgi:hypothetical protein
MDSKKLAFLKAVVGPDGADALHRAAERSTELSGAIYPRAILAWLDIVGTFDGELPGTQCRFAYKKSGDGYHGFVKFEEEFYDFKDANLFHVAGSIAVALGADDQALDPELTPLLVAKLGKSIDVLVKSTLVRAELKKEDVGKPKSKKRIDLPGQAAKPLAPEAPTPPTPKQPKMQTAQPGAVATSPSKLATPETPGMGIKAAGVQLPKPPKAPKGAAPSTRVVKSLAYTRCGICGGRQFTGATFVGCRCFSALAKSVTVTETKSHFNLSFGDDWDADAIDSLIDALRK